MKNNPELLKQVQEVSVKGEKFTKSQLVSNIEPNKTNRVDVQIDWTKGRMAISY